MWFGGVCHALNLLVLFWFDCIIFFFRKGYKIAIMSYSTLNGIFSIDIHISYFVNFTLITWVFFLHKRGMFLVRTYIYYLLLNNAAYENFILGFDFEFHNEFCINSTAFPVCRVNVSCDSCIVWSTVTWLIHLNLGFRASSCLRHYVYFYLVSIKYDSHIPFTNTLYIGNICDLLKHLFFQHFIICYSKRSNHFKFI